MGLIEKSNGNYVFVNAKFKDGNFRIDGKIGKGFSGRYIGWDFEETNFGGTQKNMTKQIVIFLKDNNQQYKMSFNLNSWGVFSLLNAMVTTGIKENDMLEFMFSSNKNPSLFVKINNEKTSWKYEYSKLKLKELGDDEKTVKRNKYIEKWCGEVFVDAMNIKNRNTGFDKLESTIDADVETTEEETDVPF